MSNRNALSIHIGRRIHKLRLVKDKTAHEFGIISGVSSNAIYNYEHSACLPRVDVLYHLAKHFNKSMDYFFEGYNENPK